MEGCRPVSLLHVDVSHLAPSIGAPDVWPLYFEALRNA